MARKRVSPFDPPSQADFDALGPDRVRKGPKGGYVWLCESEDCRQIASHLSTAGKKVCKRHGGSTAKQRDPEAKALAKAQGEELRPPGRPVQTGFYTSIPGYKVDELVQQYRESGLDPDATDDDMLYLRAYLDVLKDMAPDAQQALEMLREVMPIITAFKNVLTDENSPYNDRPMRVSSVLELAGELDTFDRNVDGVRQLLHELVKLVGGIEERHANLITLAKVRAETRLKNSAAMQLDAFTLMLDRLQMIIDETLPSNYAEALQTRFAKDLSELPRNYN